MSNPVFFVSHSSKDEPLANELSKLLQSAFALEPGDIRCTSVEKYEIAAGKDYEAKLREELESADAVVSIITENSLRSTYVMFELGARWGRGKTIFPVLGPGTVDADLSPPLNKLQLTTSSNSPDIDKLLQDVSKNIRRPLQKRSNYKKQLDKVARNQGRPLKENNFQIVDDDVEIRVDAVDEGYVEIRVDRQFTSKCDVDGSYPYRRELPKNGEWEDYSLEVMRKGASKSESQKLERGPKNLVQLRAPLELAVGDRLKGQLVSLERFPRARGYYQLTYHSPKLESKVMWTSSRSSSSMDVFYYGEDVALKSVPNANEKTRVPKSGSEFGFFVRWDTTRGAR